MPKIKEKYSSNEKVTVKATQCLVCLDIIFLKTVFDSATCNCKMTNLTNKGVNYINNHVANDGIIEEFDGPNIFRLVVPYTDSILRRCDKERIDSIGQVKLEFPTFKERKDA